MAKVSDDELLREVWIRFGDSWCTFSSKVRSSSECPICHQSELMTRHHLVPIAEDGGKDRAVRSRYVKLCRSCHEFAHRVWGPGDQYRGPTDREIFVAELRKQPRS